MSLVGETNAEKIWNYCKSKGMNDYGCAGVLSSLDCESGLNPMNLEDSYERTSGFTDESYTAAVNSGSYTKFITDGFGFGLAQWTYWSRKQGLLAYARGCGVSISDMEMQLNYLYKELMESFASVLHTLKTASSVLEASNAMLLKYECPLDTSISVQNLRASYAQKYYDRFANATEVKKSMGYITVNKKANKKLSEHFSSSEFDCHGNGCCTSTVINEKLVEYLELLRKHFGKPITITSGYRCLVHNRNVGGATGSRHSKGDAADIVIQGIAPRTVAQYAESIGILGIGLYETAADGHFVHIDTRDYKSFWYGQACAARTTFGTYTEANNSAGNSTVSNGSANSDNYILASGSTGTKVKELQENLITLGYSCGKYGADGSYGSATALAVRKFQSDHGLSADGVAGYLTLTAITKELQEKGASGHTVKVTESVLNIRKGAGTNYPITGSIRDRGVYTIVSESSGSGATKWGKLADGRGWISMDYCTTV